MIGAKPADFSQPPGIPDQYQARYFDAVTDVLARQPDAAQKGLDSLLAWQGANVPEADRKGAECRRRHAQLSYSCRFDPTWQRIPRTTPDSTIKRFRRFNSF